ncbi:immunoglobulin-like domain-containing protein, partial [Listeria booriae]|uniref:immunoglobulin-like domain-containing protein n=1 Tax=Listeria booriae TaxID=1552123 RepID=UPI001792BF64
MSKQKMFKKYGVSSLVALVVASQVSNVLPNIVANGAELNSNITQNSSVVKENDVLAVDTVNVSTFAELKAAFDSDTIRAVSLENNITFTGNITGVKNSDLTIYGNDNTIDMSTYYIHSLANKGRKLTLENLNTLHGRFGENYAAISYDNFGHVTARNVTHDGGEYILAEGGITLGGKVNVKISDPQNLSNAISVWGTRAPNGGGGPFVVEEGALVDISQESGDTYYAAMIMDKATEFRISKNAKFNLQTINNKPNPALRNGAAMIWSHATLKPVIESGAEVSLYSSINKLQGIRSNFAGMELQKGAKLNINTNGAPGIYTTASTTLNFNGDFDIRDSSGLGAPIYATGSSTINIAGSNISAWNKGNVSSNADLGWNNVTGKSTFTGSNTTANSSDNSMFNSQFKLQEYTRINSQAFAIVSTTINSLNSSSVLATGKAEPGSQVEIKVGNTIVGQGVAKEDGTYSIGITKQLVGSQVTAVAEKFGQTSSASTIVKGQGTITPNTYTVGETNIVGKYTGDVTRAHLFVNGVEISNGGSFANGNFTYFVRTGAIKAGDNVVLRAVDKNGNQLDEQKVNVVAATQGTITPNTHTVGETNIVGKYTGDVARAHLFVNGVEVSNGGTFANGNFTYFVRAGAIKAGDNVVLRAVDKNGRQLDEQKVNVVSATQGTITPNAYIVGATNITGKYTGDVTRAHLFVNGVEISNGGT